jgi:hypothetical protein
MADKIIDLEELIIKRKEAKRELLKIIAKGHLKDFKKQYGDGPDAGIRISEEMKALALDTRSLFMLLMFKAHSRNELEKYETRIKEAAALFDRMEKTWFEMSNVIADVMRDFDEEDKKGK